MLHLKLGQKNPGFFLKTGMGEGGTRFTPAFSAKPGF